MVQWIHTGGGPLLMIAEELLPYWNGADPPEDALVPMANSLTDYDRACNGPHDVFEVTVGPGKAVVFGDDPVDSCWWRDESGTLFVVRAVYTEPEVAEEGVLARVGMTSVEDRGVWFQSTGGRVYLFDSAYPGEDLPSSHGVTVLAKGSYSIGSGRYQPDSENLFLVHRFDTLKV